MLTNSRDVSAESYAWPALSLSTDQLLLIDESFQLEKLLIEASSLGSAAFMKEYGIKYAYLAGSMYKGIASKELVVALGKAGLIGFLGSGGMKLDRLESDIRYIQDQLAGGEAYGVNLLNSLDIPELEQRTVELFLTCGVRHVEASAYLKISAPLVRYRLSGAYRDADGRPCLPNRLLAKVSRPEVASAFMAPPPKELVSRLVESGELTAQEAALAGEIPVASGICVEADSGGHTDQGVAYALMPAMLRLREETQRQHNYRTPLHLGAAGGIGTPAAAAAAFILGADFIMTGSINQCTVEAGISDKVKGMLQEINVQDTAYAPAGDMFEMGAKVQVLKRGLFFPARADKLFELYSRYNSIDELDEKTKDQIQNKYFKRSFEEVWEETKSYYTKSGRKSVDELESNPKQKMALIFRWYFVHSARLAASGSRDQTVDYQVHCGPALGAFNQWVKGGPLEAWNNRKVADLAELIMRGAAELLTKKFNDLTFNRIQTSTG
jgi:trans-AT polyketide synthase, acyltransferase and oxidoreductase domains